MNALLHQALLFAQRTRMEEAVEGLGAGFRERHSRYATQDVVLGMAGIVVGFLLIWLVAHLVSRLVRRLRGGRAWLFLRLCKAHGLTWSERRLLWRLARFQTLDDPAQVFVDPECWDESLVDPKLLSQMDRVTRLRERLFCDLEEREAAQIEMVVEQAAPSASAAQRAKTPAITPLPVDLSSWMEQSEGSGVAG